MDPKTKETAPVAPDKIEKAEDEGITEEALVKSLTALEALAGNSAIGRERKLLKKAMKGKASEEEVAELAGILNKSQGLSADVKKSLAPEASEHFEKSIELSDYLGDFHKAISGNLVAVAEAVEKADRERTTQVAEMSKAIVDLGKATLENAKLLKSLESALTAWGKTPQARPRAVQSTTQVIEKSFGGQAPAPQISKEEIMDALGGLLEKSVAAGRDGMSPSGEQYDIAASKYEQFNQISTPMLQEVLAYHRANKN